MARIAVLEETGAVESAAAVRWSLSEVEGNARAWWFAELTRDVAAAERGWSPDTIDRKLKRGELTNVGGPRRPRVIRADLWTAAGNGEDGSVFERHRRARARQDS